MPSAIILNDVVNGAASTPQTVVGTQFTVRCSSGACRVMIDGSEYDHLSARESSVYTVSSGDIVVLEASTDNTTAWYGDI